MAYSLIIYIYIYMEWESLGSIVVGPGGKSTHVILVLSEYIWNAPVVLVSLPAFDDTVSLDSPLHQVVYPPGSMVPPWVTTSHFLVGNRETELKLATFSSLLLFHVFQFFYF